MAITCVSSILFGREDNAYRDLTSSMISVIRFLLGKWTSSRKRDLSTTLGPLFVVILAVIAKFVFTNIIIAIWIGAFAEVNHTKREKTNQAEIDLCEIAYNRFQGK